MTRSIPKPNPSHRRNYLVWSSRHNLWWRTANRGYTNDMSEAGQYTKKEAHAIAGDPSSGSEAIPFTVARAAVIAQIADHERAISKLRRIVKLPIDIQEIAP